MPGYKPKVVIGGNPGAGLVTPAGENVSSSSKVYMMGNVAGYASSNPPSLDTSFLTAMGAAPTASGLNMLLDATTTWASVQADSIKVLNLMGTWNSTGPKMFDANLQASTSDNSLSDVINQDPDVVSCFSATATAAYANGIKFIRMAWEFQGFDSGITAPNFVAGWQSVVDIMNNVSGVPPNSFRFVWNPNGGAAGNPITWPSPYYPGNAYVGCIAIDMYHMGGTPFSSWLTGPHPNLSDIVTLARSSGVNCVAIPEWGVVNTNPPSDIVSQIDDVMNWARTTAASGIEVILGVFGRGWPSTSGTFGMQCTPAAFTELTKQVGIGRAAGWIPS